MSSFANNEEINIACFRECDVKIVQRVISMETESSRCNVVVLRVCFSSMLIYDYDDRNRFHPYCRAGRVPQPDIIQWACRYFRVFASASK